MNAAMSIFIVCMVLVLSVLAWHVYLDMLIERFHLRFDLPKLGAFGWQQAQQNRVRRAAGFEPSVMDLRQCPEHGSSHEGFPRMVPSVLMNTARAGIDMGSGDHTRYLVRTEQNGPWKEAPSLGHALAAYGQAIKGSLVDITKAKEARTGAHNAPRAGINTPGDDPDQRGGGQGF